MVQPPQQCLYTGIYHHFSKKHDKHTGDNIERDKPFIARIHLHESQCKK